MKNFFLSLWHKYKDWQYERKCLKHLGMKPTTVYVTKEQYDALVEIINRPPDPKVQESIRKILNRRSPWDNDYDN